MFLLQYGSMFITDTPIGTTLKSLSYGKFSLFSTTQKFNDPCGQHIYIREQCLTFDIDKDK